MFRQSLRSSVTPEPSNNEQDLDAAARETVKDLLRIYDGSLEAFPAHIRRVVRRMDHRQSREVPEGNAASEPQATTSPRPGPSRKAAQEWKELLKGRSRKFKLTSPRKAPKRKRTTESFVYNEESERGKKRLRPKTLHAYFTPAPGKSAESPICIDDDD